MGGNALKYFETSRRSKDVYYDLMDEVLGRLDRLFPTTRMSIVVNYAAKEDFGDGDILIDLDNLPKDWIEQIHREFLPNEMMINRVGGRPITFGKHELVALHSGDKDLRVFPAGFDSPQCSTVSFDYDGFQIDIIPQSGYDFHIAEVYYAYNDLGNLMGRVAERMGFKYGWSGLVKQLIDGTNAYATLMVSRDAKSIFEFLGYDHERWMRGFETVEDVYAYAASTPYFNRTLFDLDSLNHENRARNRKRKTYMGFIEWLKDKPELDKYDWYMGRRGDGTPEQAKAYQEFIVKACAKFNTFLRDYMAAYGGYIASQAIKEYWNGEEIGRLTGLPNVEWRQFMRFCVTSVEAHIGKDQFAPWLVYRGKHEVKEVVDMHLPLYLGKFKDKKNE